ncbi:MAG TPA: tryptophan dimethylallyltransferase family protein [Enhygromyxa sp.]|nr:tryptophan dimethylallyltransferase family protein [Enhygromyxa sp.]
MADDLGAASQLFDLFSQTWGHRTRSSGHPASDITDDSSPFEFSLAIEGGRPELRMLTEAQGGAATPAANWEAAWELTEQLAQTYGISIARARGIADLFQPDEQTRVFSLWHAACLRTGESPDFKLYFNPFARGASQVDETMQEAFARLGQSQCYEWIREHAMLRGELDHYVYMSLDLADHAKARTKVYIAHRNASASEVERVMAAVRGHVPGDATGFCNAMAPDHDRFGQRPLLTCMAFVAGEAEPSTVTLHLPIRCYASNDQVVLERVGEFLSPDEAQLHASAVRSMATRPLGLRTGLQTYTSFRRVDGRKRLTVYLSPEVYSAP